MGCMDAIWVDSRRYYHCILCLTWYGGNINELVLVPDPRETSAYGQRADDSRGREAEKENS